MQKFTNYEDDAPSTRKECHTNIRKNLSVSDFSQINEDSSLKSSDTKRIGSTNKDCDDEEFSVPHFPRQPRGVRPKIAVEIPEKEGIFELFKETAQQVQPVETPADGYETPDEYLSDTEFSVSKKNLFDHENEEEFKEPVPEEKIIKRIHSHIGMKSNHLAHQLSSCKWTTGAGPRIGCMRDYPSELQFRVMEEVQLSPRPAFPASSKFARRYTPTIFSREANDQGKRPDFEVVVFCESDSPSVKREAVFG